MAEEEDFSKLPLSERFAHKNWKVRKEAYEAATKEFKTIQDGDPLIQDFTHDSGLWKGAVGDSNVAAQQEALAALCAFLEIAGTKGSTRTRSHTITPIVEKGLTGRPAAKQSALEALMLYIELDKADPVIEELLPLLAHKQPKIIAATLSALTAIFHAYGCKTVEPKPVIKTLPKMYGHADKNVRAEAQNLTVELYRWLKEAMKPLFWGELKPVQQQDLEKLFEKVKDEPAPKQERLLRSQQAVQEAAAEAGEAPEGGEVEEEAAEIDLEPEYIAVDVFEKVPKDFQERLASSKWKDRKDALDELYTAVNVPAIEEGPFDEIMRGCAKSMKDANIAVVTVAANCVECIAKGLKRKFAKYRSTIMTPMLERFKEKKQSVTDAIAAACDAVFASTGLTEILEEVLEALKNKNPQVKLESTRFLARSLKTTKEAPQPPEVKSIAESATKLLADAQATQRDAAAEVLGVMWKIMGDRNMLTYLESLDEIKKTKIKEFCDQAEVKAKWKPKAAPPPKPAAAPAAKKTAGKRPPASAKKPAPAPRPLTPDEEAAPAAPLAARPTSRPANKLAASKSGLQPPASGLKKTGLARPGIATAGSSVASPRRTTPAPPMDEEAPIAPPRGLTAPGRGLASRPLGKASISGFDSIEPSPPAPSQTQSSLSFAERAELSDLRAEADLLRQQNSDLRTDKMRQQSQIHELQNQNAQLIEDHTRDMLSLRAKEAQLTRARSDFEEANERANSFGREIERHKREIQRLTREGSGRESPAYNETPSSNYGNSMEPPRSNAHNGMSSYARPTYNVNRNQPTPNTNARPAHNNGPDPNDIDGEGKENIPDSDTAMYGHKLNPSADSASPPPQPPYDTTSGTASPAPQPRMTSGISSGSASAGSRTNSLNRSQSDGVESWRRAAEVTQNLKARIEMMKAKQNLSRGNGDSKQGVGR